LLRKGLKQGGLAPVWLGGLDALLSVPIIVLLSIAMVASAQVFTLMAGAGHEVLNLPELFDGISHDPGKPEYYWVYVLVISTQFPSLLNLMIGATALVRRRQPLVRWCVTSLPKDGTMASADRYRLAFALAAQLVVGIVVGAAAEVAIVWCVLAYLLPLVGVELLEVVRAVAAWFPV
jgi:hypothetical protein